LELGIWCFYPVTLVALRREKIPLKALRRTCR